MLLPGRDDVRLEALDVLDGWVMLEERGHATTAVRLLPLTNAGRPNAHVIKAPAAGVVSLAENLDFDASEVRFQMTDLVTPKTLCSYGLRPSKTRTLWVEPAPGLDPALYRTERRWANSPDGTAVPVTLAWRADRPSGPGPCLLYGYGAYEFSSDTVHRSDRPVLPLLDRGVLTITHVRGGGEMGRHWYLDGKLAQKHHSFDDFVTVARYLVGEGLTSPDQLAANGRSAGGLLVGASVNLAPDLFACVVAEVPFVDCLTTMLDPTLPLTVTEQEEWGDPVADEEASLDQGLLALRQREGGSLPANARDGGTQRPEGQLLRARQVGPGVAGGPPGERPPCAAAGRARGGTFRWSGRYQVWKKRAEVLAFVLEATGAASRDCRPAGSPGVPAEGSGGSSPGGERKIVGKRIGGQLGGNAVHPDLDVPRGAKDDNDRP